MNYILRRLDRAGQICSHEDRTYLINSQSTNNGILTEEIPEDVALLIIKLYNVPEEVEDELHYWTFII